MRRCALIAQYETAVQRKPPFILVEKQGLVRRMLGSIIQVRYLAHTPVSGQFCTYTGVQSCTCTGQIFKYYTGVLSCTYSDVLSCTYSGALSCTYTGHIFRILACMVVMTHSHLVAIACP